MSFAGCRLVLLTTFVCAALLPSPALHGSIASWAKTDSGKVKPNVLFIFSDDQRADTIGAWGNAVVKTPHLDRLVGQGTSFNRTYCMGSMVGAVCMPSRAMLLTGRTLFRTEVRLQDQPTWPEQFAADGYSTFITGKWHNGPAVTRVFQQGKAVFMGGMGDPYNVAISDFAPGGKLGNKRQARGHSVELFSTAAVEFLSQQKGDKPFLCYVSYNLPHDPRIAPTPFHEDANKNKPPLPANFLPQHPFDNGDMVLRDELLAPWPRTPEVVRQHLADYYAAIAFMDQQIGRILQALKESGQYENTIIVFSSDHGLAIGSHGLMGKQSLYDHSMRAPLVIAGPGLARGKTSDAMCYLLDIFPTLGDLTGVTPPEGSEGKSLAHVLTGKGADAGRDVIFTAYRDVQRAVRDNRWKLIVYPKINKVQLFDLQTDPDESKDLSTDSAYAKVLERMMNLLKKQQEVMADEAPLSSQNPQPQAFDPTQAKKSKPAKGEPAKK